MLFSRLALFLKKGDAFPVLAQKVRESERARKAAAWRGLLRVSGRVGLPFPRPGRGGRAHVCRPGTRHASHLRVVLCLGVRCLRPSAFVCVHPQVRANIYVQ